MGGEVLNIMCYVYDLILNKQLIEMFTCNTDITACIVVTVADVPPSYISTSVFGDLLSQSCDIILDHMYFFVFFSRESDWAHRDDPEQPEPKVCQEVCSRLLF